MRYHIEGTATEAQNHHYLSHAFTIPEGTTRLDIDYEYSPKRAERYGNLMTLSLFDPHGHRGTGHRGQPTQHITLSAGEATPGYFPGVLPPGVWNLMINCNLINPNVRVEYHIDITTSDEPQPAPIHYFPGRAKPRGAGWYRGDLHGHTIHSDGSWDCEGLLDFARQNKLDFITLTDHNTTSGLAHMDSLNSDELLVMGGWELTTFFGHALALGLRQSIDWRVRPDRTMTDIRAEVEAAGGMFVIAHPFAPGDPICTGCRWDYDDLMPGTARMVEIWNEHWDSGNQNDEAVQLWYSWLNQGIRIFAEVGTDIHGVPDPALEFGFNVVYAREYSEAAILDAVRHGHSYVSSGPVLDFSGRSAFGKTAMVGETLDAGRCELTVRWSQCRAGDRLRLVVDGVLREELLADDAGEHTWVLGDGASHWAVIEVRAENGNLRAVTNPIFVE
jgi:hypothetical protein